MMVGVCFFIRVCFFFCTLRPANQDADPIDSHLPIDAIIPERNHLPISVHEAAVCLKDNLIIAVIIRIEIVEATITDVVLYQEKVLAQFVDMLNLLTHLVLRQTQIRRPRFRLRVVLGHLFAYRFFLRILSENLVVVAAFPETVAQFTNATISDIAIGPA